MAKVTFGVLLRLDEACFVQDRVDGQHLGPDAPQDVGHGQRSAPASAVHHELPPALPQPLHVDLVQEAPRVEVAAAGRKVQLAEVVGEGPP